MFANLLFSIEGLMHLAKLLGFISGIFFYNNGIPNLTVHVFVNLCHVLVDYYINNCIYVSIFIYMV